MIAFNHEQEAS